MSQDLNRLHHKCWLNDKIINYYIKVIGSEQFKDVAQKMYKNFQSNFFIFPTYFCIQINE